MHTIGVLFLGRWTNSYVMQISGTSLVLEEIINHVQYLQRQVEVVNSCYLHSFFTLISDCEDIWYLEVGELKNEEHVILVFLNPTVLIKIGCFRFDFLKGLSITWLNTWVTVIWVIYVWFTCLIHNSLSFES